MRTGIGEMSEHETGNIPYFFD